MTTRLWGAAVGSYRGADELPMPTGEPPPGRGAWGCDACDTLANTKDGVITWDSASGVRQPYR